MPSSIWTGSLSLGLVVVPVRLNPAIQKKTVRFHELVNGPTSVRQLGLEGVGWKPQSSTMEDL